MLSCSGPLQVQIYLPESSHGAPGVVRAIVKDSEDAFQGASSETYLDSDGEVPQLGDPAPRCSLSSCPFLSPPRQPLCLLLSPSPHPPTHLAADLRVPLRLLCHFLFPVTRMVLSAQNPQQ